MTEKTTRFDAMAHLEPEDHIDLLNDALETGDASVVAKIVGEIARARGISNIARETAIGRSTLYKAFGESRNPTIDTLLRVLAALNLKLEAQPLKVA